MDKVDFKTVFDALPTSSILVTAQEPHYPIVAVTDCYTEATFTKRDEIIGRHFFEVFADHPDQTIATGIHHLMASFHQVIRQRQPHKLEVYKYYVRFHQEDDFVEKYWDAFSKPILDKTGQVKYILHTVTDVTAAVKLKEVHQQMTARNTGGGKSVGSINGASTGVALFYGNYLAVRYVDDFMLQLLGKRKEEVMGRPGLTIFPNYQREGDLVSALLEAFTSKKPVHLKKVTLWAVALKEEGNGPKVVQHVVSCIFEPMLEVDGRAYGAAAYFTKAD